MPQEICLPYRNNYLHIDVYSQLNPKATIVILHGVGGNGRLLEFIAIPLWRAGFEVICPDLPMYGLTEYQGTVTYADWILCSKYVCNYYRKTNVPLFLFGLSAGGMLAYQTACELDHINGLIATCLLDQRDHEVTEKTASSPFMASAGKWFLKYTHEAIGFVKLPMKYFCKMDKIVNDASLAGQLVKDPLSSGAKVSLEFLYGMLNPDIPTEPEEFHKCPVLLVHPENDRWTDPSLSLAFFERLSTAKEFHLLMGAGHFPIEPKGLMQLENACIAFIEQYMDS